LQVPPELVVVLLAPVSMLEVEAGPAEPDPVVEMVSEVVA
jgi:hypothetical protein